MDLSRHSPAPARFTGIGLVIAVHVIAIWALCVAFLRTPTPPKPTTQLLPPIPRTIEPLPPQPPLRAPKPTIVQVPVTTFPVPVWTEQTPTITTQPPLESPLPGTGPFTGAGTGPAVIVAEAPAKPVVRAPGAVCSVMPRPEVPAVSWTGDAVLHVLATVRGGRVVGSELRVQGAVDPKTRRALQHSVEAALAGYQCAGDATFEQDFAFRLN